MFHNKKAKISNVRRGPSLCGLLVAAALSLLPLTVGAQCAQWDVSGTWTIEQSNGFTIATELQQNGRSVTGKAGYSHVSSGSNTLGVTIGGDPYSVVGTVNGSIDADDFYVEITWQGGAQAVYRGRVGTHGRIDGTTYDKRKTTSTATWLSVQTMKCPPPPQAAPPRPKPIKSSGKSRIEPAPPPKPPFITTGQIIVQPYALVASVYLGWDGGPDHPNAEVVAVNEDGQTLMFKEVFKKPKAGVELRLQRGRQYMYVLRDAGVTLSTVSFVP